MRFDLRCKRCGESKPMTEYLGMGRCYDDGTQKCETCVRWDERPVSNVFRITYKDFRNHLTNITS